jgi:hypothetical protein
MRTWNENVGIKFSVPDIILEEFTSDRLIIDRLENTIIMLKCLGASLNGIAKSSMVTDTRGSWTVDLIIITWYHTHVGRFTFF